MMKAIVIQGPRKGTIDDFKQKFDALGKLLPKSQSSSFGFAEKIFDAFANKDYNSPDRNEELYHFYKNEIESNHNETESKFLKYVLDNVYELKSHSTCL